jgi:hypothetical protein
MQVVGLVEGLSTEDSLAQGLRAAARTLQVDSAIAPDVARAKEK